MTYRPTITDEMLYAYVDHELDDDDRAAVEAAIAADPALAQRVEQQRSLRTLLGAAYRPVLEEPMPERLSAAVQAPTKVPAKARIVELASARKAKRREVPAAHGWTWKHWGGMAACLAVGVFAGSSAWFMNATNEVGLRSGQWVAGGRLSQALSTQLASAQAADAPVKIGLSFVARDKAYCRSFSLPESGASGLACRHGNEWQLRVLAQDGAAPGASAALRMASSSLPPVLLKAIEEQMQGAPLDAEAERAAARKGWRP